DDSLLRAAAGADDSTVAEERRDPASGGSAEGGSNRRCGCCIRRRWGACKDGHGGPLGYVSPGAAGFHVFGVSVGDMCVSLPRETSCPRAFINSAIVAITAIIVATSRTIFQALHGRSPVTSPVLALTRKR